MEKDEIIENNENLQTIHEKEKIKLMNLRENITERNISLQLLQEQLISSENEINTQRGELLKKMEAHYETAQKYRLLQEELNTKLIASKRNKNFKREKMSRRG